MVVLGGAAVSYERGTPVRFGFAGSTRWTSRVLVPPLRFPHEVIQANIIKGFEKGLYGNEDVQSAQRTARPSTNPFKRVCTNPFKRVVGSVQSLLKGLYYVCLNNVV